MYGLLAKSQHSAMKVTLSKTVFEEHCNTTFSVNHLENAFKVVFNT